MHGQIKLFMNPITHQSLYGIGKSSRIPHQAKPSRETIIPHQAQPIFNQYSTSIPPMKNNAQRKDLSILTVTVNQNRERITAITCKCHKDMNFSERSED